MRDDEYPLSRDDDANPWGDEDFERTLFGDLEASPTDEEIAEELEAERVLSYAKRSLTKKPDLDFKRIALTKDGEVFQVIRKKGEVRLGQVQYIWKSWKYLPAMNVQLTIDELDEIAEFMDKQI